VTFVDPYPAAQVLEAFGRNLPGFSLPRQYPTVPAPTVSPVATPSETSRTSTGTTVASPAPVVPQGVHLTKTALYSVCG